jgi:DNA-binding MarR family transcriptional regulator
LGFELGPEDAVIHQPVRLRVMTFLFRHRDASFAAIRDQLSLTDGNLGAHIKTLEANRLVASRRSLQKSGFQVRIALTAHGASCFRVYSGRLRALLDQADDPA